MADYAPTGKPDDLTRYDARALRREFDLIAEAVNSKAGLNAASTVSTTTMLIESPATKTFTVETGKDFAPGQSVYIADTANPGGNNMTGILVSYARDTTGVMVVNVTSKNGSGTKSAWTIGVSNQSGVTLGDNTFTGHQNFARATVASAATTSDIWNAAGNQIDFTGIATVTGFPAAPQAGASRELICAAACSFTAGANMLIDGRLSGETILCAANDVVRVLAVSLTQFRLTVTRYNGVPPGWLRGASVLRLHTSNGYGSTNTRARRLATVLANTGQGIDWNYVDSATLGMSVTLLNSGVYNIVCNDQTNGTGEFGVSLNSAQLTTNFASITESDKLLLCGGNSGRDGNSITCYLPAGSVLVFHGATDGVNSVPSVRFRIERLF